MNNSAGLPDSNEEDFTGNHTKQVIPKTHSPHKPCGINSNPNKFQSASRTILFPTNIITMEQPKPNNEEKDTMENGNHTTNVIVESSTEGILIDSNKSQETIETFKSAKYDIEVKTIIQDEEVKTEELPKIEIPKTPTKHSNNTTNELTPIRNTKKQDITSSEKLDDKQEDFHDLLKSNSKLKSTNEMLEKESIELKSEISSLKKDLATQKKKNRLLNDDLTQRNNRLKEEEQSVEKLTSNLDEHKTNILQIEEMLIEMKKVINQNYIHLKQQIIENKTKLMAVTKSEYDSLQNTYRKKSFAKRSFDNTLITAMATIDSRIKDLTMKEEKKIVQLTDSLNKKELQLEQLKSIVDNLTLFDINLRETIETMIEHELISTTVDDLKLEFQQTFKKLNPSIIGFRTTHDSTLVNDIQQMLSHIKFNFGNDVVNDLQNIISKSNSNRDESWLELHKDIENLQQTKYTQSNKVLKLANENDILKQQLLQLSKENSSIKAEMSTQSDIIDQSNRRLQSLVGDEQMRITFEQILLNNKTITKETYDILEVDRIDNLTMIELQNVIKNLIIFLNIPFSKMTQKIPMIGIYLMYERNIYAHFANRLYYQINGTQMSLSDFNREVYSQYTITKTLNDIKHPLEPCLDNLCASIITKL